jgi:hypothetical protein
MAVGDNEEVAQAEALLPLVLGHEHTVGHLEQLAARNGDGCPLWRRRGQLALPKLFLREDV